MGLWDKIVHGGPETQERKKIQAEARKEAFKAEMEGYKEGLIKGAKKRGKDQGFAKGSARGGFLGTISKIGAGMETVQKKGGVLVGDIDFGGIGGGLGTSAFGLDSGSRRRTSPRKRRNRRSRERIVYVERRGRR